MSRSFTHHWKNSTWFHNQNISADDDLLRHIAGNMFTKRGVDVGDAIYVVTVLSGNLYLCGKMIAGKICDAYEAAKYLGSQPEDLWEASEHIVASEATPMQFDLDVPLVVTTSLRFVGRRSFRSLKFSAPGQLDKQTLRGVRELESSSALELDDLLPPMQHVKPAE